MSDEWIAEVSWAGEYVFLGSDRAGHTVVYDSGEAQRGISPMTSLLTSLGACSGMDVVAILRKRKQRLSSLRVLLTGERPKYGYPKPWRSVTVKYVLSGEGLDRNVVEEAIRDSMAKFCSVAATIRPTVKISHSYEIVTR